MDFFERLLGIAPDNGTGWAELLFLAALAVVPLAALRRATRRGRKFPPPGR